MITEHDIIEAIAERMYRRRQGETGNQAHLTLAYAVSVRTSHVYVGYNDHNLQMEGEGHCAENRAYWVAKSYRERLEDLVFFALNKEPEFFNACSTCQGWLSNARG